MAEATERMPDSRVSAWGTEPGDGHDESRGQQPPTAWQRLAGVFRQARRVSHAAERSSAELTTQPAGGRGQALREAHRALRQQLRRHRPLRALLPHLLYIEQALGRQGSQALLEMPLWVMQRGLQQLGRLPWDDGPEPSRHPLMTLRQRLIEAIELRSLHAEVVQADRSGEDSFNGSADSELGAHGPISLPPAGVVVEALHPSEHGFRPVDPAPGDRGNAASPGPRRR